jgi:three-Cys-motif partner protein
MAILGQAGYPEFVYIDGFAGPGRYSKGEDGSPVIAVKVALEHQARIKSQITFLFVEERKDRADVLEQVLDELDRPSQFVIKLDGGATFEQAVGNFLDNYEVRGRRPPPIFAFIDPFGWSGVPFPLVKRILSFPSSEALITFMYEEINRFISHPQQEENFNAFFGTAEWRGGIRLVDPTQRNRYYHDLYMRQLRQAGGIRHVRSFEMRNDKDVTDYYLFYATQSLLGLKKMKESMWTVDPSGEFRFSDATDPRQLVLFGREPDFRLLQQQVIKQFQGQETPVEAVEDFVVAETSFRETHYKRQVLDPMERAGQIEIPFSPRKRRFSYPPGTVIRFL